MIVIRDIDQNTLEWFALRAGVLTASEFDKIPLVQTIADPEKGFCIALVDGERQCSRRTEGKFCGQHAKIAANPPLDIGLVYKLATERITGQSAEDGRSSYWMDRGRALEARARSMYEILTGREVETVGFIYQDEEKRIGCSPDGLVVGERGDIEIKCPKLETHVGYVLGQKLPPAHRAQAHGGLMVSGLDWRDFVSFCPDAFPEIFVIRVERDEGYISELRKAALRLLAEVDEVEARLRKIGGQEPSERETATAQLLRESIG